MNLTNADGGRYECGSQNGTALQLCPACRQRNNEKRQAFASQLYVDTTGTADPFLYKVLTLSGGPKRVAIGIVALIFLAALIIGKLSGIGFCVMTILGTGIFAVTIALLSWLIILAEVSRESRVFIIPSILFPPFLIVGVLSMYRTRDTSERWWFVRNLLVAQVISVFLLSSVVLAATAVHLDLTQPGTWIPKTKVAAPRR